MPDSPYAPPNSELGDVPQEAGSPVKALTLGFLTDIGGTIVISTVLSIVFSLIWANQGVSLEQVTARLQDQSLSNPVALIGNVLGTLFSYLGGFVCARIVRRSEMRYAAILAVLNVLVGMAISPSATSPAWLALSYGASIAAILLGGAHARAKNRKN
jgi:type III secretory pathway component EscS